MFRRRPPTSTDAQTPPVLSHRDRNEMEGTTTTDAQTPPPTSHGHHHGIKGRAENLYNTVSSPSLFCRWMFRAVRTALQEKGSEKRGPGTKHLSRRSKLALSVLIDMVGFFLFFLPIIGQILDLGWAPISSGLVYYLYGNNKFAGLAFVEGILPGLDFIPSATIAWFLTSRTGKKAKDTAADTVSDTVGGPVTGKKSRGWFPWGSSGKGNTTKDDRNRRGVDPDLIKAGAIYGDGDYVVPPSTY